MSAIKQGLILAGVFGLAVGITACGVSSEDPTGAGNTSPPTTSVTPPPGTVAVILDKSTYNATDIMTVTIYNRLTTSITAHDHQSGCTIVSLQTQRNGSWVNTGKCLQGVPTRPVTLATGSTTTLHLTPGMGGLAANTQWATGMYRVAFTYLPGPDETTGSSATIVYSAFFAVI